MEHNNYFFYIVVALSVVGSIVKALKKKPVDDQPESKPSVGGDILKRLLEEMREKDDYIPRNPIPAPAAKPVVKQPMVSPSAKTNHTTFDRSKNAEMGYVAPESNVRHTNATAGPKGQIFEPIEEFIDPFMASIDLSSPEEMKKAIIYSEIFRTKF